EACIKGRRFGPCKMRVNGPVFLFLERLDLALALYDQSKSHGLHAPSRKPPANFVPKQRGNLISDDPVEHTARLLRIDQVPIDFTRPLKSFFHRALGNFIESDAADALMPVFLALFLFLLALGSVAEFFCEVRGNGLAFPVGIGR